MQENELLTGLRQKLADAQGAKARAAELQALREASYKLVFDYVLNEQNVLRLLYAPIQERLNNASGALNKLSFNVVRTADVAQWAKRGEEELIDLRRQGQFKGSGSLQKIADQLP